MRTLRKKYLSEIPIDETIYKADFNILEKYQGFSAELLRLALLGLALYGFMISNVVLKFPNLAVLQNILNNLKCYTNCCIAGAILLIAAAGLALSHRYYSTDCMTHFIRQLRLTKRYDGLNKLLKGKQPHDPPIFTDSLKDNLEIKKILKTPDAELSPSQIVDLQNYYKSKIDTEESSFENDLKVCTYTLAVSSIFLFLGIVFAMFGFINILFAMK